MPAAVAAWIAATAASRSGERRPPANRFVDRHQLDRKRESSLVSTRSVLTVEQVCSLPTD
jgi:hypothetical protein